MEAEDDQQEENDTMDVTEQPNPQRRSQPPSFTSAATSQNVEQQATGTATITITEEAREETNHELLTLTLRARPTVTWDESVVDNEGMGRKSSKRCCIFHKQRAFDESSTDTSDYDSDRSGSSTASGASGDGGKKPGPGKKRNRKIARPKQGKNVPDYQRYHA